MQTSEPIPPPTDLGSALLCDEYDRFRISGVEPFQFQDCPPYGVCPIPDRLGARIFVAFSRFDLQPSPPSFPPPGNHGTGRFLDGMVAIFEIESVRPPEHVAADFMTLLESTDGVMVIPDIENRYRAENGLTVVPCRADDKEVLTALLSFQKID